MIPAALLVRRPPALARAPAPRRTDEPQSAMSVGEALRSPQFIMLLLTNFFCCATHSGPIFHTVSYAADLRHSARSPPFRSTASKGLAGMGGRIAFGLLGDRFGAKRVLVSACWRRRSARWPTSSCASLGAFYAVAALFGFIYAGVMPLYAVLARENFPLRMMGTVIGGTAMAGSLGMATGPLAGGLIYDALRQLQLALRRLLGDRDRRLPDRLDVQAFAEGLDDLAVVKPADGLAVKARMFRGVRSGR